jgi:hypothetical protein
VHRIKARRRQRLAAATPVPKRVEIYVVVVDLGTVDVIERGTTVLSLMSKPNDTHGLRHICLRRLHEELRGIFNPLQMCHGIYLDMLGSQGNSVVAILNR